MSRVLVIGGGAAGMMAAVSAAEAGNEVLLLEKNEKLGKKLFITGKGRCNVTNAADRDGLFAGVCTNEKFLYSAFCRFDNRAMMEFLERAGCPLKTERGERVFPVSDHASSVTAALQRELKRLGVQVRLRAEVKELLTVPLPDPEGTERGEAAPQRKGKTKSGRRMRSACVGVRLATGETLTSDRCIVCTGGLSYPSTGATGDGYRFAEDTGHALVEPRPALVPFVVRESWCAELMGLSLRNVSVRMTDQKRELYRGFGEMLFTHFGVSGPLILSASSFYKRRTGGEVTLAIDLKPALSEEQLDRRILRDFEGQKNRQFQNALGGLFPAKLVPVMVRLSGIRPDKPVNEVTKEERRRLLEQTKGLVLTVTGTRSFDEAIITQGGVSVKDVDPSTMESRLVRGLYFAGEVLDVDAVTGGFNLQIAWSTGHLAGRGGCG